MRHTAISRDQAALPVLSTFLKASLLALCAALFLLAGAAHAAVDFRVESRPVGDPVRVYVTVTDGSGQPITGLTAGNFNVVAGAAVQTTSFSAVPGNQSVVFTMDASGSITSAYRTAMIDAVIEFVRSMEANDRAAVVKFNASRGASVIAPFTVVDNGGSGDAALDAAARASYSDTGTGTNIFDALMLSIQQFTSTTLPTGPKAIVLLSDGIDNASTADINDVLAAANAAGLPLHHQRGGIRKRRGSADLA